VSIDSDGKVKLRGQGNVTVMINGKISSMTKSDALKSLPAANIQRIEVNVNPGAKYKASALGIINIILKKGKDEGLNASITTTGGSKDYYGGLVTLNHKSKKVNFFLNTSYFHRNPIKIANYENEYFNNGITSSFLNENSKSNSKDNVLYGTVGADFYLSNRNYLSTTINYSNINNNSNTLTSTDFFDASNILSSSNERTYLRKLDDEILEIIIDFEHNFKKEGRNLTSSITYTKDFEYFKNTISNSNTIFVNNNSIEKNTIENTIFDLQFVSPLTKKSTYTIGYNGEFGNIPFTYSGTFFDNNINYKENIHAAFIEFENKNENFYYSLGLRTEFSEITIDYLNLNSILKKEFKDLLPSIYLEYNLNDKENLSLNYSKKTQKPSYYQLQPFEQKFSETSSYIGNETLNPYYMDTFSLNYTTSSSNFKFSSTLFYNIYKDWWQTVTYENGEQFNGINKIISTLINIKKVNYYGIDFTSNFKPNKILNFIGNIYLLNLDQFGTFETTNLNNETINKNYNQSIFTTYFSLLTQVKIPNTLDFQINAKHDLKSQGTFTNRKARTYVSLAINKDLFNKKASLNLTIDDLFKSNKTDTDRFDSNYFSKSSVKNKYQTILLSFTYRFNQSKKGRKIDFSKKEIKPNY